MPGEERVHPITSIVQLKYNFKCEMFQVLGSGSPESFSRRYAPLPTSFSIRNGPSQFGENLPSCFRALLVILQTKSPLWRERGLSLELYLLAALNLVARSWMRAFSRASYRRSRCVFIQSLLVWSLCCCWRRDGWPISTGIIASVP